MKNKIYNVVLLFDLEHFLIKYHEQSTFLIVVCDILVNYFLITTALIWQGGYALIYFVQSYGTFIT